MLVDIKWYLPIIKNQQANGDTIGDQQLPAQERTRPATVEHSTTNDWSAVRPL